MTITLSQTSATLKVNSTVQLSATIAPSDATNKDVTWSSSNTSVATVSANGIVTAKGLGEAVITATADDGSGVTATCVVKVEATSAEGIAIDTPAKTTFKVGETIALTATVTPETATDKSVTWSTSNARIAKVNDYGVVTAVSVGEVTITATNSSGHQASVRLTVIPTLVSSITLSQTSATIKVAETLRLTANTYPLDATNGDVVWTSSNRRVATVSDNGVVTAVGVGSATITATAADGSGASASCDIEVEAVPDVTVPSLPRNASITVTEQTENSIAISWNPANDDMTVASDLKYEVYVQIRGIWKLNATLTGTTSYVIEGLDSGTEYKIAIYVSDEAGNESSYELLTASTAMPDAIEAVLATNPDAKMYSPQGVLVNKNYRGIVIINGKKYYKK